MNQKKLKKTNLASKDQLKNFVENLPAAVAMFDRHINYIAYSDRWIKDYKLDGQEILGRCHYDIFPEIPERWKKVHQEALHGAIRKNGEDSFIGQNKKIWLKWDVRPWYESDGSIGGIIMLTDTFTDQKNKELEIDLILKSTKIGIWKYDPLKNYFEWDESMYSLYGISKNNFAGNYQAWSDTLHPDYKEQVHKEFNKALKDADEFVSTFAIITEAGETKYVGVKAIIERNSNGQAISVLGINIDKTQEVVDSKRIEEANQYLDLALEGANLGIWDWKIDENCVVFDRRWGEMLGIPYEELDMKLETWQSRVHPDDLEKCFQDINNYLEGRTDSYQNIHRMKHKDGHWVYIFDQGKISARNNYGKPIRFTGTHLDITKQKEQEEDLRIAKNKAEMAEKSKSEFLANMSHEIRSPMNGVLGMVEMLSQSELNKDQKEMLETIRTCGEGLLVVINDILDFSKIESNKLELENVEFDLIRCLNDIMSLHSFSATKKGIDFTFINKIGNLKWFKGDQVRIKQVLTNIISNAIKFTNQGKVEVVLDNLGTKGHLTYLQFRINDTGIGIPLESQKNLFSSFTQADTSITRKYGGTGLGLTISKRLVDLMEGSITYTSEEKKGTSFCIDLALEAISSNNQFLEQEKIDDSKFSKKFPHQILLVEDNPLNQKVASSFLKKLGYRCDVANNGEEAIAQVKLNGVDYYSLIFMDMQMPVMDGLTATKTLRKLYAQKTPVIIALTANAFESDLNQCLEAGMQDFLSKPVRFDKFKEVLIKYYNARIQKKAI